MNKLQTTAPANTAPTFTSNQFTESRIHRMVAEASMLGLKPGEWPEQFTVQGLGNGQPFVLTNIDTQGGHDYMQVAGCITILIFND